MIENRGEIKNKEKVFVKGKVCLMKIGGSLIYNLIKTFPLFFTGCELRPL